MSIALDDPKFWMAERACLRKAAYDKRKHAKGAAALARKRTNHADIEEYRCQFCGKFHIGHAR